VFSGSKVSPEFTHQVPEMTKHWRRSDKIPQAQAVRSVAGGRDNIQDNTPDNWVAKSVATAIKSCPATAPNGDPSDSTAHLCR
jgi:hypothetical protein